MLTLLGLNFGGLVLGFATFLTIGFFHPIVIKAEYYYGVKCWWAFCLAGVLFCAISLLFDNWVVSSFFGVVAFSCFWSILEVFQQRERVRKGWFPKNPARNDY